jgi:hypothetical protein
MRLPITVTNVDPKTGKVINAWCVKVGKRSRTFGRKAWADGGLSWINSQLGNPPPGKNPENEKSPGGMK